VNVDPVKVLELLPDGQNLLVREGVNWKPGWSDVQNSTHEGLAGYNCP
jgi:hypothetical protein